MGSIYRTCHLSESPFVTKTLYYLPELCCRGMLDVQRLHYNIYGSHNLLGDSANVDNPTPNSCEIDLYSRFVDNLQIQITTRASTETACLYLVFCRVSQGRRVSHSSLKLLLPILKFFSQSLSVQVALMWGHQLSLPWCVSKFSCV